MRERPADCDDGSLDFLICRADESPTDSRPRLYRIDTAIEIDRRQESVDERTEASPCGRSRFPRSTVSTMISDRVCAWPPALTAVFSVAETSAAAARANDVTVRTDIDGQVVRASRASRASFQAA